MIVWVSVTAWISAGITTPHVNTLRITLSYVILIPLYTHGRTVIYIGKMSVRPPLSYVILIPLCTHGQSVIYIGKMTD